MSGAPFTYPPNGNPAASPPPDPNLVAHYDRLLFQKLQERDKAYQIDLSAREAAWERKQQEMQAVMQVEMRAREAALAEQMQSLSEQLKQLRATSEAPTRVAEQPVPADDDPMTPTLRRKSPRTQPQTPTRQTASSAPTTPHVTPRRTPARKPSAHTASPAAPPKGGAKPSSTPQKKAAVKAASQTNRMLSSELPEDASGLKKAMTMHIRLLSGWTKASDVPSDPPEQILAEFQAQFSDEADLQARRQGSPIIPPSLVQVGQSLSVGGRSQISRFLSTISDHILQYIQTCLAKFGFIHWCPDLRQPADSLYNAACRIIAIDTFKQALVAHAYDGLQPNKTYATKMDVLVKIYNHFVHHYIFERYKKNTRDPGSVETADTASPVYRNRARLAESRRIFLLENGYPDRYLELIDPKATSDDEADSTGRKEKGRSIHWIKKRPERSREAEVFFRRLESTMERMAKLEGRQIRGRIRKISDMDQKESEFLALPQGIPIDYFDPDFFNSLQPRIRSRCASQKVALLPDINLSFTRCDDEFIDDNEFTQKFQDVLSRYKLGDLETLADDSGDFIDDDEEMDEEYEEDGIY